MEQTQDNGRKITKRPRTWLQIMLFTIIILAVIFVVFHFVFKNTAY